MDYLNALLIGSVVLGVYLPYRTNTTDADEPYPEFRERAEMFVGPPILYSGIRSIWNVHEARAHRRRINTLRGELIAYAIDETLARAHIERTRIRTEREGRRNIEGPTFEGGPENDY